MHQVMYVLQRLTAMILAPLVLVHLGMMIYAVRGGLSAEEILGRTQDSLLWAAFYGLFVVAAATHGAIGLRFIVAEASRRNKGLPDAVATLFLIAALGLGARAIYAVVWGGSM